MNFIPLLALKENPDDLSDEKNPIDDDVLKLFREKSDAALLGEAFYTKFKDKYPFRVGEPFILKELGGVSITFVGVFKSSNYSYNTNILAGREFLQQTDSQLGVFHQIYVKIDDPKNAQGTGTAIDEKVPRVAGKQTTTIDQRSFLSAAVEDLQRIIQLARIVILVVLAVILVAVANTISMATRDRVQEIGILRSMGFRKNQVAYLVLGESMILAMLGGLIGLTIAYFGVNFRYGIRGLNMLISLTWDVGGLAVLISLAVGFFGGLLPALGTGKLNIVNSLRNVD